MKVDHKTNIPKTLSISQGHTIPRTRFQRTIKLQITKIKSTKNKTV